MKSLPTRGQPWRAGPTILGAIAILNCTTGTAADDARAAPSQVALAELIAEAVARNPEIRAAAQRLEASRAMVPQARTLPDPMINLGYEDMDERETMVGVSQEIPFPGKLKLRGEVAAREAEASEQELEAMRLTVIARLKEAYYELHLAYQSVRILTQNKQLLVDFARTTEARYTVGDAAQADVFRAQAEVSRILGRLATLRQQQRSLGAEMNRLLNRPASGPVGVPEPIAAGPLQRSEAEIARLIAETAPLVKARMKAVERGNAAVALARREYYPDFEIAAQGLHDEPMNENGYQVMLNVTVPLFYASKQRYGVREAMAGREESVGDLQAVRQELAARAADDLAQIRRAEELIRLLDGAIIPQARLTLASARTGYAVGQVDFLMLLSSLFTLQENELDLQAEIVEHEKARARLEEMLGETP